MQKKRKARQIVREENKVISEKNVDSLNIFFNQKRKRFKFEIENIFDYYITTISTLFF